MSRSLRNLQALRGAACLLVVGFHSEEWERRYGIATPIFSELGQFGYAGVDLFFVLSGFIITHAHAGQLGQPGYAPGYLLRRGWRLLPIYWAMMAIAGIACTMLLHWPLFETGWEMRWLRWLLLLPSEVPNPVLPPAWSLTYELTFYMAFVGLFLVPLRWGIGFLAAWGAAVLTVDIAVVEFRHPYAAMALSPLVLEFLFGCAVAAFIRKGITRAGPLMVAVGMAGFVLGTMTAGAQETAGSMSRVIGYGLPAACLVYGLVACELRGGRDAPRWLRRTGDASYSIYLWHYPAGILCLVFGVHVPHTLWMHRLWLLGTLVICVGGGFLLHWGIERPLMRLARRPRLEVAKELPQHIPVRKAA
ncbi:MAG TPA: acyltransferase [Urbifossiella sp.]